MTTISGKIRDAMKNRRALRKEYRGAKANWKTRQKARKKGYITTAEHIPNPGKWKDYKKRGKPTSNVIWSRKV